MASFKKALRRLRAILWTAFTLVVILAAVLVGLGKLLLPYTEDFKPELEARLGGFLGKPVRIEDFEGDWKAFGPSLALMGLRVYADEAAVASDAEPLFVLNQAALEVRPFTFMLPGKPLYQFSIIGADIDIGRDSDGHWSIAGKRIDMPGRPAEQKELTWLSELGDVELRDSRLTIDDQLKGVQASLDGINGSIQLREDLWAAQLSTSAESLDGVGQSGRVEAVLQARVDGSVLQSISAYIRGNDLNAASWLPLLPPRWRMWGEGHSDHEVWLDWNPDRGVQMQGQSRIAKLSLKLEETSPTVDVRAASADWYMERRAFKHYDLVLRNVRVDQGDVEWSTDNVTIQRNPSPGIGLWVSTSAVDADLGRVITQSLMRRYADNADPRWKNAFASGQVERFELLLSEDWQPLRIVADGHLDRVADWPMWPAAENLNVVLRFEDGVGDLRVHSDQVLLDWPRVHQRPQAVGQLDCVMTIARPARRQWSVASEDCTLDTPAGQLAARFNAHSDEGRPVLHGELQLPDLDLAALPDYWPDRLIPAEALEWLHRSLPEGRVQGGQLAIHGDLDYWPFREGGGRLEATLPVSDARLLYLPEWPEARVDSAVLHLLNDQLSFELQQGQVAGYQLNGSSGKFSIASPARLRLDLQGSGGLQQVRAFLAATPLQQSLGLSTVDWQPGGDSTLALGLDWQSGRQAGGQAGTPLLDIDGRLQLEEGQLALPGQNLVFEGINGRLDFTEAGLSGEQLDAQYGGQPVQLSLAAGNAESSAQEGLALRAELQGELAVAELLPAEWQPAPDILALAEGRSNWQALLEVPSRQSGDKTRLTLSSDLAGTRLELPAPFSKPAQASLPLRLQSQLAAAGESNRLRLDAGSVLRVDMDWRGATETRETGRIEALSARLGGEQPPVPVPGQFSLGGQLDTLDMDGWLALRSLLPEGDGWDLQAGPLSLSAQKVWLMNREFPDQQLSLRHDGERWEAIFEGPAAQGRLRFPGGGNNALVADFDRLQLAVPFREVKRQPVDPRRLPVLHFHAREFAWGGLDLDEMRIEAWPQGQGYHIDKAQGASERFRFQARGDWTQQADGQRSSFDMHLGAEALGELLGSLDVESGIDGGQTLVHFDAWWPGSPSDFELARLNGQLDLEVADGQIANVAQPGAGRLLGLISLQALPRRLSLDFRDVFDKGFSFDRARGTFELSDGVASTDDLEITSTAAVIAISGKTDLSDKQYDQVLSVRPGVGSTLPIIGALAGGPGGAAAGFALQGLLQKPLGEAAQVQYSITGSWTEPVVTPIAVKAPEPEIESEGAGAGQP